MRCAAIHAYLKSTAAVRLQAFREDSRAERECSVVLGQVPGESRYSSEVWFGDGASMRRLISEHDVVGGNGDAMRVWQLTRPGCLAHADSGVMSTGPHVLLRHIVDDALSLSFYLVRRHGVIPVAP